MTEDVSTLNTSGPSRGQLLVVAGAVGLLLAATAALWANYGTAVFFETIRAGFIACFG